MELLEELKKSRFEVETLKKENKKIKKEKKSVNNWEEDLKSELNKLKIEKENLQKDAWRLEVENINLCAELEDCKEKLEKKEKEYEEMKKFLSDASLDYLFENQTDYGYQNQTEKEEDIHCNEDTIRKAEMERKKGKKPVDDVPDIVIHDEEEFLGKRKRSTKASTKTPTSMIHKIK